MLLSRKENSVPSILVFFEAIIFFFFPCILGRIIINQHRHSIGHEVRKPNGHTTKTVLAYYNLLDKL